MAEAVRLCPHCANSIGLSAAKCPYCKKAVEAVATPQWPTREGEAPMVKPTPNRNRISTLSIIVIVVGLAALVTGVYLAAGPRGRSESQVLIEEKIKELQEKEQKIQ